MKQHHTKHTSLTRPQWEGITPAIKGLVLAGGESSRMGTDKGSIEYHGIPQRDFMLQLLEKFSDEVFLSCHPDRIPEGKYPVIIDSFLDLGPYGAVLSAFRFDPNTAWLVVACDIPMLDESMLELLIRQRDPDKIATCFHDPATGFPEPLITIWEPRAYPVLLQWLGEGNSCLRKILINTDCKIIHTDRPEVLRNANTPEESQILKELLR